MLALLPAGTIRAQTLRGQVVERGTNLPVVGGQIVLMDASSRVVGTVLTNAEGRFVLRAPAAGRYTYRADMIGRQSATSEAIELGRDATVDHRLELEVGAISLNALTVQARPQCGSASGNPDVHMLWEEARKALAAEAVTRAQRRFRVTIETYTRVLDAAGRRVLSDQRVQRLGLTTDPFVTRPAEELAEQGYMRREGDDRVFFGPTGGVLLSDAFLRTHCFWVHREDDRAGEVGLAFEPIAGRRLPDVEGTLWVDQGTAELGSLEFRYVNLPNDLSAGYGGRVEFRRLPAGGWIVSKWVIRMPVLGRGGFTLDDRFHERLHVVQLTEQGGEVIQLATRDGRFIAQSTRTVLTGTVRDASVPRARGEPHAPLVGAEVLVAGTPFRALTDASGRFRISDLPDGSYMVTYLHPRLDSLGFTPDPIEIDLVSGRTRAVEMILPRITMTGSIGGEEAHRDSVAQFLAILAGRNPTRAQIFPDDTVPGRIEGRVIDHATGNPLPGVVVEVAGTGQRMVTDSAGEFRFGGVPAGNPTVHVTLRGYGTKSGGFRLKPGGHVDLLITIAPVRRSGAPPR